MIAWLWQLNLENIPIHHPNAGSHLGQVPWGLFLKWQPSHTLFYLNLSFRQIIFWDHFITSSIFNCKEKEGRNRGKDLTERCGQNACICHDTRKSLLSRQRCWRWTDLNLKLNSPCVKQQGLRRRLSLWLSYLERRGNWLLSCHRRDSPLSLYMAGASLVAHMVKKSICNAGDLGLIPGLGKIPWRREWQPTPVSLPGESCGQRSLAGHNPWGRKGSDTSKRLTFSLFLSVKEHGGGSGAVRLPQNTFPFLPRAGYMETYSWNVLYLL